MREPAAERIDSDRLMELLEAGEVREESAKEVRRGRVAEYPLNSRLRGEERFEEEVGDSGVSSPLYMALRARTVRSRSSRAVPGTSMTELAPPLDPARD